MKKLLLISSIFFVASCSLFGGKPSTFDEHYVRFVETSLDNTEKMIEAAGVYRPGEVSGVVDAVASVPMLMSGSFQTKLGVKSTGRDADITLKDGVIQYDGLAGSGRMSYDFVNLISKAGNLYISYQGISDDLMNALGASEVLKKYEKTWISFTQGDAMSGATAEEVRASKIAQKFSEMSLDDVKKYLTQYPLFRSTADLGMSGSLHLWSVELDREKVIALIEKVSMDLSGENMSDTDKARLQADLSHINMIGTIGFSSDDATVSSLDVTATQSGVTLGKVNFHTEKSGTSFAIQEGQTGAILSGNFTHDTDKNTGNITLVQSGSELGTLTFTVDHTGGKFHDLSAEISAQGISVVLKHTRKDDGNFDGRLLLPVGSLSWNGTFQDNELTALKLQGASPAGALDLDLTASGEMIHGPFVLRSGTEEILRANVGLLNKYDNTHSKFRFIFDVPQGTGSSDAMHFEFGSETQYSSWDGKISVPSPTTPLQKIIDELNSLVSPISPGENIESGVLTPNANSLDEKDAIEPLQ